MVRSSWFVVLGFVRLRYLCSVPGIDRRTFNLNDEPRTTNLEPRTKNYEPRTGRKQLHQPSRTGFRLPPHAEPQTRAPDTPQKPVCHDRRGRVAGLGNRREYGDLFVVSRAHPAPAAGPGALQAGQPLGAGPQARVADVQSGGRLRRRVQLSDVPGPRTSPDVVHRDRGPPAVWRQSRLPRADVER